jgi:chromosome segregation ATPase
MDKKYIIVAKYHTFHFITLHMDMIDHPLEKAKQSSLHAGQNRLTQLQNKIKDRSQALETLIESQNSKITDLQHSIEQEQTSIQETQNHYESVLQDIHSFHQQIEHAEKELLSLDEEIQNTQQNKTFLEKVHALETELTTMKAQHTSKLHEYEKKIEFFFADTKTE